jgi:hypothetical protein
MRPTFKKLEVRDIANLERLVAENAEGVEPGLKVVDSRLLLGQASIDLVGLDASGSLTLIALDFTADEGLLLRVMDAYSWCLEYPDTLRRLYPMAQASASKPPRILFIVERLTDSFLRRVKQLSFLEIDCLEFRHLEVNGESVVYFDHVERIRKSVVASPVEAPAPIAPVVVKPFETRVEPIRPAAPALHVAEPAQVEPVRPEPPLAQTPSARFAAAPAAAVIVVPPVEVPESASEPARALWRAPEPAVEAPVAAAPVLAEPAAAAPAAALQVADELAVAAPAVAEPVAAPPALQLQAIEATASMASVESGTNGRAAEISPAEILATSVPKVAEVVPAPIAQANVPAEAVTVAAPVQTSPVQAPPVENPIVQVPPVQAPPGQMPPVQTPPVQAPPVQTPVWAKPLAQPNGNRPYFFAQATKGSSPVEVPTAVAAPAPEPAVSGQPSATKTALVDDRPELESLSFPKDGLSRQWLEFLSQLGSTK